jgi:hypothetical protein
VELLQKLFTRDTLIDIIENKEIYSQLQKFNAKTDDVKAANLTLEQLGDISYPKEVGSKEIFIRINSDRFSISI